MKNYTALALQAPCHAINACPDVPSARAAIVRNIDTIGRQIRASKAFIGPALALVVVPEYFLTAYPLGDTISAWAARAALEVDGPEYASMGRICQDNGVFLSGNAYETDRHFPGLYFQTSFVIDASGNVVLRYRRLVSMFAPTPHDVWQKYLDIYGIDGVFPVADTALGRLACVASEEILYPEISRAFALRGAEVLLHSTSEIGSPRLTPKDVAKRARAFESMAYVVSANSGGILDTDFPAQSTDGMSKIVDFRGEVMVEAGYGASMVANAEIDLAALRRHRQKPAMGNVMARQRLELFAQTYAGSVYPANTLLDAAGATVVPERSHFMQTQMQVIADLSAKGVFQRE